MSDMEASARAGRRRLLILSASLALIGTGAFVAWRWSEGKQGGKATLKSRIVEYDRDARQANPNLSQEEKDAAATALVNEYFSIDMSYEEVVRILAENDMTIDGRSENIRDWRTISPPSFFNRRIVSIIPLRSFHPLLRFEYRLIFDFKDDRLNDFTGAFELLGP